MVDKKLSEFSAVQASDVSDLVVLFLDGNNSIKNGRLSFNSLVSMLALLSGNNTFTGDNTFSGDVAFEETATFNKGINGTAARATADASGNNIANTYATKTELDQKSSFKLFHHDWFDYQLNDKSWLRADTFSWQDGTVYSEAYNHLVSDYNGGTSQTETVGSYTITYVLATDGHKITTDETTVANIYSESGVAWYYILDTTNQRFKLPRTKYGFTGLRDTVGKYVPESLPNIGCQITDGVIGGDQSSNGAFYISGTWSGPGGSNLWKGFSGGFDASRSSSTYQDSAPVQQRATQMYLYFYVGQFSQSATEQTAGLNSELFNGKVDLDAANLSTAGKSLISGLGMPSNRYIDLTLGASGNAYTAPANGYYMLAKASSASGQYIWLITKAPDTTIIYDSAVYSSTSSGGLRVTVPAKKGDTVTVSYTAGGNTDRFRFIYAEGEENV